MRRWMPKAHPAGELHTRTSHAAPLGTLVWAWRVVRGVRSHFSVGAEHWHTGLTYLLTYLLAVGAECGGWPFRTDCQHTALAICWRVFSVRRSADYPITLLTLTLPLSTCPSPEQSTHRSITSGSPTTSVMRILCAQPHPTGTTRCRACSGSSSGGHCAAADPSPRPPVPIPCRSCCECWSRSRRSGCSS